MEGASSVYLYKARMVQNFKAWGKKSDQVLIQVNPGMVWLSKFIRT